MRLILRKPLLTRTLRTYARVATKQHTCWRCPHPILPGDEYNGEVIVCTGDCVDFRLSVWKEHAFCPGNRYEDEKEPDFDEDAGDNEETAAA